MFNKMNAQATAIVGVTSLGANMQVWQFPINFVLQTSPKKKVGAYILFGGGAYRVKGEITAATTTGGLSATPSGACGTP